MSSNRSLDEEDDDGDKTVTGAYPRPPQSLQPQDRSSGSHPPGPTPPAFSSSDTLPKTPREFIGQASRTAIWNPGVLTWSTESQDSNSGVPQVQYDDTIEDVLYDFEWSRKGWEHLKDYALSIVNDGLKNLNIMGLVSGRVKSYESLEKKLRKRNSQKPYKDYEDIMKDQLDFLGLRVCLYFPDQKWEVMSMLKEVFEYNSTRLFERDWPPSNPQTIERRFGGYTAEHIWVCLKTDDRRFLLSQGFEIQLRSVLMDAWSGISHDLEYKLLSGPLTGAEARLLDTLKGQVEAAEVMLELLHQVHLKRVSTDNKHISSQEEMEEILADFLPQSLSQVAVKGDMVALFALIKRMEVDTPIALRNVLLKSNIRRRIGIDLGNIGSGTGRWRYDFDPLPKTTSYYVIQRLLRDLSLDQYDNLVSSAQQAWSESESSDPEHSFLSYSLLQALLWLHHGLYLSPNASHGALSPSQVQRYAILWCTHLWAKVYRHSLPPFFSMRRVLPKHDPRYGLYQIHPGIDFIAELSCISFLPKAWPRDLIASDTFRFLRNQSLADAQGETLNPGVIPPSRCICDFVKETNARGEGGAWEIGIWHFMHILHLFPGQITQPTFPAQVNLAAWLVRIGEPAVLQDFIDLELNFPATSDGDRLSQKISELSRRPGNAPSWYMGRPNVDI